MMEETDCEKLMDEFMDYDEEIALGKIVQIYYFFDSHAKLKKYDEEIERMASEELGVPTGCNGCVNNRRDLDFLFPSKVEADKFRLRIKGSIKFYEHSQMNSMGNLIPKPTLEEIEMKRQMLKQIHCGGKNPSE